MTEKQAIRLLHPDTTAEAIAEIEYKHGFRGKQAAVNKINKACVIACKAMEKQIPKKPIITIDGFFNGQPIYDTWCCPNCGKVNDTDFEDYGYCPICGQALDWSDAE
jgi:hypothetical protein